MEKLTQQQKEEILAYLFSFSNKRVFCSFFYFSQYFLRILPKVGLPIHIPIDEIKNHLTLSISLDKINVSNIDETNCCKLLQFLIENEIHFNWENKDVPEITIWDKSNRKCHIIVGKCYTFYSIHQPQKVDFNNLIKIIKQTVRYDKN